MMPTFNTIQLPPPRDWAEFEDLCCDLWRYIWGDPHAQRNGRSGQPQAGVDVFGRHSRSATVEGVQCKLKSPWLGQKLTKQEVEDAIADAEQFRPPLAHLTIATTSPRDARLQQKVGSLSASRAEAGKFTLTLQFWEDIHSRLIEHQDLLRKHYPQFLVSAGSIPVDPAANTKLQAYLESFRRYLNQELPSLIPTHLFSNEVTIQLEDLKDQLAKRAVLHLHGPSGSGKSHLAKHLALELLNEDYVPLLVQAKYYDGAFERLLDRSVAHLTAWTASSVISACEPLSRVPLLIVDGFNECPEHLRADLAQCMKAFLLRKPIRIVVTSRPEAACTDILEGCLVKLGILDMEERDRLISYYGELPNTIAGVLKTPLDVCIAAESAARLGPGSPNQHQLFFAYTRGRLHKEADHSFALLWKIAEKMAEALTSTLIEPEVYRLMHASAVAPSALMSLRDSGLMTFSRGYYSFWHEKVQRFFQAEALLTRHSDPDSLAAELRKPRNEEAVEFIVSGLADTHSIRICIPAIRSEVLLLSMLRGDLGSPAKVAIENYLRYLLDRANEELRLLDIVKGEVPSHPFGALSVTSSIAWEEHEYRHFGFLGRAWKAGFFFHEVLALLEGTEEQCLRRVKELYPKGSWHYLFPFLYVGIRPSSLPATRVVQSIQFGMADSWSKHTEQSISLRLEDLENQSPGMLLLLACHLQGCFWSREESGRVQQHLISLLNRLWGTGLYHLRLDAAQLAESAAHRLDEPLRSEVEALLETFLGENIVLNSAVVDALAQFRDLGISSEERAITEIQEVIDGSRDEEACEVAAGLYSNILEEPISQHYSAAIDALQGTDRIDFLVMAALGSKPYSFSLSSILRELVASAAQEARSAFEKWSAPPSREGFIMGEMAAAFLLAHIGLARVSDDLPLKPDSSNLDEASWITWGKIMFWLHKVDVPEAGIRAACEPCWRPLHGSLFHASIDPIYQIERHALARHRHENLYRPVSHLFKDELRKLFHRALPEVRRQTSLLGGMHDQKDYALYMIEELGSFGDEESILILQAHVDSEILGSAAVRAVRAIRSRIIPADR